MKISNLFGKSVVSMAVLAAFGGAYAAQNGRANRALDVNAARMPTMPTVPLNTIGSPVVNTVSQPAEANSGGIPSPIPTPTPGPIPGPTPTPSDCPDGGVRDSSYTVSMCMDDLLQCVNNGALQGGINDLFNSDVRNSIMSGMRLCQSVVDKCIHDVRVDCRNIYLATTDVWLDFNSRVIQPEYYNFVLRKTGLTPNQAENTCLLLDRNTYGESFAAVSDSDAVNREYNKKIGAYNRAENNSLSKDNPLGKEINTVGYDGNRGHYARWDAAKAECLIRVAAYNKDNLITNKWLGIGDDTPAEVWQKAGSTFTCNKDLFDFSLMNQTKSAAVISLPAATVLGTAIGAGAGASAYNKKMEKYEDGIDKRNDPCTDEAYRKELGAKIYASNKGEVLRSFAYKNVRFTTGKDGKKSYVGTKIFEDGNNFNNLTEEQCRDLHDLQGKVKLYESYVQECLANPNNVAISNAINKEVTPGSNDVVLRKMTLVGGNGTIQVSEKVTCNVSSEVNQDQVTAFSEKCTFVPLRSSGTGVKCEANDECLTVGQIQHQIDMLGGLLSSLMPSVGKAAKEPNKAKEIGKGAAIGAATGAGVGGLVTGITALVERGNISCKVGDGLNSVGLGKSYTIDSLKDFYVKWNLRLPNTVSPTAVVTEEIVSWQQACGQFNSRLMDCPNVQVHYQPTGSATYVLVNGACHQSGSVCVPTDSVMNSHIAE